MSHCLAQVSENTFESLDEMDTFLGKYNVPKLPLQEIENQNR